MSRLESIEARLAEIEKELSGDDAEGKTEEDLAKIEEEVRSLQAEKSGILKAAEKRASLEKAIAEGRSGVDVTPDLLNGGKKEMEERKFDVASKEYRSAWLKKIRGIELSDIETRAMTSADASAGAAVPVSTVNKIVEKVKEFCPILNKIELCYM